MTNEIANDCSYPMRTLHNPFPKVKGGECDHLKKKQQMLPKIGKIMEFQFASDYYRARISEQISSWWEIDALQTKVDQMRDHTRVNFNL
jgi:hypothetical protein